jgi:hypothetical protein
MGKYGRQRDYDRLIAVFLGKTIKNRQNHPDEAMLAFCSQLWTHGRKGVNRPIARPDCTHSRNELPTPTPRLPTSERISEP